MTVALPDRHSRSCAVQIQPGTVGDMTSVTSNDASGVGRILATKVPQATLLFWIVKILSTTVGETGADFLNTTLGLGLSVTTWAVAGLFAVSLTVQFLLRRYVPVVYWINVVIISVVGTLFSDNLVDGYGVPLAVSTSVFAGLLAITFIAWFATERTLSIHSITTFRREVFYWLAVLFAFALGTSAGDWFAEGMGLGYLPSAGIFAGVLAVVAALYFGLGRRAPVLAFWCAYILTRPFGASTGDFLSQSVKDGGLGLGTTVTSDLFLIVIALALVVFSIAERRRTKRPSYGGALPVRSGPEFS